MDWKKGFRVIEIMNENEILIDYGYEHGASLGDRVIVYSIGDPVNDPETKEQIGTLDVIKEELKVIHVTLHFSICKKTVKLPSIYSSIEAMANPLTMTRKSVAALDVNQEQISNRKWKKGGIISLNDSVMVGKAE